MTCSTPVRLHLVPALPPDPADDAVDFERLEQERSLPALGEFYGGVETVDRAAVPSGRRARLRFLGDRGMATAEYAVGLIAACAFAAVLYKVVTNGNIYRLIDELAGRALALV